MLVRAMLVSDSNYGERARAAERARYSGGLATRAVCSEQKAKMSESAAYGKTVINIALVW